MKPIEAFALRDPVTGQRQSWCRSCFSESDRIRYRSLGEREREERRAHQRLRRAQLQSRVNDIMAATGCVDCGERDPIVLDLDHIGEKTANVSDLIRSGASWGRIAREIAKCEVRCVNDHKRVTRQRKRTAEVAVER